VAPSTVINRKMKLDGMPRSITHENDVTRVIERAYPKVASRSESSSNRQEMKSDRRFSASALKQKQRNRTG